MDQSLEDKNEKVEKTSENDPVAALKQTLMEKGISDVEVLAKLAVIEKTNQEPAPAAITHKTVNQLQKAEKTYENTKTQIVELDEKWKVFSEALKTKYHEQGALYKAKRKQLVTKNVETKEKITQLRSEIQKAAVKTEVQEIPEEFLAEPDLSGMAIDLTMTDSDDDRPRSRSRKRQSPLKTPNGEAGRETRTTNP